MKVMLYWEQLSDITLERETIKKVQDSTGFFWQQFSPVLIWMKICARQNWTKVIQIYRENYQKFFIYRKNSSCI